MAYEMAGVNPHDIYFIDKSSKVISSNESIANNDDDAAITDDAVGSGVGCCGALNVCNIYAYNPSNVTKSSQSKRTFHRYTDPKLKKELIEKMCSL